ncbi:MAG: hypothetical protein HYZ63_02150 [Candidatus Andersenbacteria bacterium]|nr:hypothetical protein [Candidatus Andersenbacteria bacterium]
MASEEKKSVISKKLAGYFKTGSRRLALFLGGPSARLLLLLVGFIISGWLLFTHAWIPTQEQVQLPAGVSARNPGLDSGLLQTINTERIERASYLPKSLASFGPLFALVPTPGPASLP